MVQFVQWLRRPANLVGLLLVLVPVVHLLQFIVEHAVNFPRYDSATRVIEIALAAENNALTVNTLFQPVNDHISATAFASAALLTWLTDWNVHVEVAINTVMAVAVFVILMILVWRTERDALAFVAFPAAVLFFSVQQNAVWIVGYTGFVLFGMQLCVLGAILLGTSTDRLSWQLVLAMVLAVLSTYTAGQGFVAWVLIIAVWMLRGVRNWPVYGLVAALAVINIVIYASLIGLGDSSAGNNVLGVDGLGEKIQYALAYLGNMVARGDTTNAVVVGRFAVGLMLFNGAAILLLDRDWRFMQIWVPVVGYSLASAAITALARAGTGNPPITSWYISSTTFFWVGLASSTAVLLVRAQSPTEHGLWRYAVVLVNMVMWVPWLVNFIPGSVESLERVIDQGRFVDARCIDRFLYIQDAETMEQNGCHVWYPDQVNALAASRLNLFAHKAPQTILGDTYGEGAPVVVEGVNSWASYQIETWLLGDVPADDVIHVAESPPPALYGVRVELVNLVTGTDTLLALTDDHDTIWHVQYADTDSALGDFKEHLRAEDYIGTRFDYETMSDVDFVVTRYEKYDLDTDNPVEFGPSMTMTGFTGVADRLRPCNAVTVRSFWQGEEPLPHSYSATLTLDRVTGDGMWDFETVVRSDSQLSLVPSAQWEPDRLYFDERTLEIPCDLPPGDYALQIGVYNYADGARLLPQSADQPGERDLALLETITLETTQP